MTPTNASAPSAASPQSKPKKGCLFYGCMTILVLSILGAISVWFVATRVVVPFLGKFATQQTVAMTPPPFSPDQVSAVAARVQGFGDAVKARRPVEPLRLNSSELNALVASRPEFESLSKHLRLAIAGDKVSGELAFPLDDFGFAGKFLNLSGVFKVMFDYGVLVVTPETLVVNEAPLAESIMGEMRNQNLAAELSKNPEAARVLADIKSIEVADGVVIVTPK